jgi:hypothetical protein
MRESAIPPPWGNGTIRCLRSEHPVKVFPDLPFCDELIVLAEGGEPSLRTYMYLQ